MSEFAREAGFYCSPQKPNSGRWVELLGVGTLGGFFQQTTSVMGDHVTANCYARGESWSNW